MFWCRVKSYHLINKGVEKYEAQSAVDTTLLNRLKTVWESSLKRAYSTVNLEYTKGLFVVLEVQERGPRGIVYSDSPLYIGMFDKAARATFIDHPSPTGAHVVRPAAISVLGLPVFEYYHSDWELAPGALATCCDAPGGNDIGKLIEAANHVWKQSVYKK